MPEPSQPSRSNGAPAHDSGKDLDNLTAFLVADLQYFGQSLLENERIGEGRFRFLSALITAVSAGLVALYTANAGMKDEPKELIVTGALIGLILFGFLTYVRMLHRDRVSEGYKKDLDYIRCLLRTKLPLQKYDVLPHEPATMRGFKKLKAGYAQTVGVVFSFLAAVLLFYCLHLFLSVGVWISSGTSAVVLVCLSYITIAIANHNKEVAKEDARGGQLLMSSPSEYFRAGAGAVIIKERYLVLAFRRSSTDDDVWQCPQGGLNAGEDPLEAAYREVSEETGIRKRDLKHLGSYPEPLAYELPPHDWSEKTGRGQVHHWYFFEFRGSYNAVDVSSGGEFRAYK